MSNEQTLCSLAPARSVPGTIREALQPLRRITRETAEFIVREMERSGRTAREVLDERLDHDLQLFEI